LCIGVFKYVTPYVVVKFEDERGSYVLLRQHAAGMNQAIGNV